MHLSGLSFFARRTEIFNKAEIRIYSLNLLQKCILKVVLTVASNTVVKSSPTEVVIRNSRTGVLYLS